MRVTESALEILGIHLLVFPLIEMLYVKSTEWRRTVEVPSYPIFLICLVHSYFRIHPVLDGTKNVFCYGKKTSDRS